MLQTRPEAFVFGVLPPELQLDITWSSITNLIPRLLSHPPSPVLTYSSWARQCCSMFKCDDTMAKIYFETFLEVCPDRDARSRVAGGEETFFTVDLSEFILFLFLQIFAKWDGEHQKGPMGFVRTFLPELCMLARDPWKQLKVTAPSQVHLEKHEVDRLRILLQPRAAAGHVGRRGGDSRGKTKKTPQEPTLSSMMELWATDQWGSVPVEPVNEWLVGHTEEGPQLQDARWVKVVAGCRPGAPYLGNCREEMLHISDCKGASIFVPQFCSFMIMEGCSDCTVFAGVVAHRIIMRNCHKVRLVVACRSLVVQNSAHCEIQLYSSTRPLLAAGCSEIMLGPYNTHYPALESHLTRANLPTTGNCWQVPYSHTGPDAYRLQTADEFFPNTIPFTPDNLSFDGEEASGSTQSIPFTVPPEFLSAVQKRKQRALKVRQRVDDASLAEDTRAKLQASCDAEFNKWLQTRGLLQHVENLALFKAAS